MGKKRIESEKRTVRLMISLYCRHHHGGKELCGDCQSLNATMRGVAKTLYENCPDVEIYGILEGYKGLIYGKFKMLTSSDFSGILTKGGTILGSSRECS